MNIDEPGQEQVIDEDFYGEFNSQNMDGQTHW